MRTVFQVQLQVALSRPGPGEWAFGAYCRCQTAPNIDPTGARFASTNVGIRPILVTVSRLSFVEPSSILAEVSVYDTIVLREYSYLRLSGPAKPDFAATGRLSSSTTPTLPIQRSALLEAL